MAEELEYLNERIARVLVANGAAVLYDITDIKNIKITESPFTMADKNPQRRKNDSVSNGISQKMKKSRKILLTKIPTPFPFLFRKK